MHPKALLLLTAFACTTATYATGLTPKHEPRNNSYYVCYQKRYPVNASKFLFSSYQSLHYQNCKISITACRNQGKEQRHHQFGWFNNYDDALNAFYMCAYS